MWRIVVVLLVAMAGFWFGKAPVEKKISHFQPEKEFPVTEHKSFAIVVYAYNQADWCERTLRSVFEQDYDHYRVIVIDDGSSDGTGEKARQFIADNNQEQKVVFLRNETRLGPVACLYRALDSCLDREIVVPLDAKDWLSSPIALIRLNAAYQNPDVWVTFAQSIDYPSYQIREASQTSYYAAIFKQIRLEDLFQKGHFTTDVGSYLTPLIEMAEGRVRKLQEPIAFLNLARPIRSEKTAAQPTRYQPLSHFPTPRPAGSADILVFSFDRPLQLYACLESIQRYMTGFENFSVLYRASNEEFAAGYERVKEAFPLVHFVAQSEDPKSDFKPHVLKLLDSASEYILFSVDDIIVKDFVDLKVCMDQMERTGAYGFYLRFGRHINHCYQFDQPQSLPPSLPLSQGIYAWDIEMGEHDWSFPNSIDMTLFKKERMKETFSKMNFKTPTSLESIWANEHPPERAVGLYFETSKLVNIPMNIVGKTGNPHMNYLTTEELLAKFNQGLKIDIEPLYKVENRSPHIDYIPEFIVR